jgi:DNA-binding NtrC family response regulator
MERILVISEDPLYRDEIVNCFCSKGFEVVVEQVIENAIKTLKNVAIDLTLLDISDFDIGIALLLRIKQMDSKMPVVIVTNNPSLDKAIKAIRIGAADYISRPFYMEFLVRTVKKRISGLLDLERDQEKNDNSENVCSLDTSDCIKPW